MPVSVVIIQLFSFDILRAIQDQCGYIHSYLVFFLARFSVHAIFKRQVASGNQYILLLPFRFVFLTHLKLSKLKRICLVKLKFQTYWQLTNAYYYFEKGCSSKG